MALDRATRDGSGDGAGGIACRTTAEEARIAKALVLGRACLRGKAAAAGSQVAPLCPKPPEVDWWSSWGETALTGISGLLLGFLAGAAAF